MFHNKTRNLLSKKLNAKKGLERGEAGAGGESAARLALAASRREPGDFFLLLFLI